MRPADTKHLISFFPPFTTTAAAVVAVAAVEGAFLAEDRHTFQVVHQEEEAFQV
jgi:hypothetical protein